ncbi:MAG: Usg family protein [Rhodospirillales bacterium]|nr:Usg family protein [Rhodospirillales bacterium]
MAELYPQIVKDYRLTTAKILYHMPDFPDFLQTYLWQEYDIAPKFPELRRFLDFWDREIEGKLHSVYVASHPLITPGQYRAVGFEQTLLH